MTNLSLHFSLYEARCRCGCGIESDHVPELKAQAEVLELLRDDININPELEKYKPTGGEITITPLSWIRCDDYNLLVGGVDNSHHRETFCDATDITSRELPDDILYRQAAYHFNTAIHYLGRHFVHVDRREWDDHRIHAWVKTPSPTVEPGRA